MGKASGYISQETVCLSSDDSACVNEQLFIDVFETQQLDGLVSNGVLGLSPALTEYMVGGKSTSNSFMLNMKQ